MSISSSSRPPTPLDNEKLASEEIQKPKRSAKQSIRRTADAIRQTTPRPIRKALSATGRVLFSTVWFRFVADLFPLAGLVLLFYSFLSPVTWPLNPSPAMQLRPYVAPDGYLPDIECTINSNNVLTAILLNSTNTTDTSLSNSTSLLVQSFLARGGGGAKGGGEGGDSLGDLFGSIADAFDIGPGSGEKSSPSNIAPHGNFDLHPNATQRLWLGPLGSCSRDIDGRKWCTKASYKHPQYNISSFVQPNAYLYPAIIQAQTLGRTTLAFIVLASISCLLSFLGDIDPFLNIVVGIYNIPILIGEAVTLWVWAGQGFTESAPGVRDPRILNTIDKLFECNQTTGDVQLTSGEPLYYVLLGDHYGLLWASVVLIYVLGTAAAAARAGLGGAFK